STAGGTGKMIEALETDEGVEDVDGLIDGLGSGSSVLLGNASDDDTKTVSPPFISRSYDLLEIGVECGQTTEPPCHEPVGFPETTEDGDVFGQGVEGVRLTESGRQLLHTALGR